MTSLKFFEKTELFEKEEIGPQEGCGLEV